MRCWSTVTQLDTPSSRPTNSSTLASLNPWLGMATILDHMLLVHRRPRANPTACSELLLRQRQGRGASASHYGEQGACLGQDLLSVEFCGRDLGPAKTFVAAGIRPRVGRKGGAAHLPAAADVPGEHQVID